MLETNSEARHEAGRVTDATEALHFEGVVQKFANFFRDLTEDSVRSKIEETYHPEIVFDDTLHQLTGRDALKDYMVRTAKGVVGCRVKILDASPGARGAVYVRWEMVMQLKRVAKGETLKSRGMSHLEAADDGRIIFHRDYWDSTAGLFEHFPVIGRVLRWIKSRIAA